MAFIPLDGRGVKRRSQEQHDRSRTPFRKEKEQRSWQTPKRKREEVIRPPWQPLDLPSYSEGVVGLHQEIVDLATYLSPGPSEHASRLQVVDKLRSLVAELWPLAQLHVIGSFKTGLFLPGSDLDLVLLGRWPALPLRTLERHIEAKKLAQPGSMLVLAHASVPIIQFRDSETGVKVDLSFNLTDGLATVQLVNMWKLQNPSLRPLVLLLKQLLAERDLSTVYTGGLSSHCLTMMVVSFLQLHPRKEGASSNLGVLLLELLQLYGRDFNYSQIGLKLTDGGGYVAKNSLHPANGKRLVIFTNHLETLYRAFETFFFRWGEAPGSLSVESPFEQGLDMASSSFRMIEVSGAFSWAHGILARGVRGGMQTEGSVLARVVRGA